MAALRAYTTAIYKVLNNPLRNLDRTEPHPFPVTIAFLREAIGKLRAVGAQEDTQEGKSETRLDLWRGMRDTEVTESFMQHGGTELAPMSTTTKLEVAVQYSTAQTSLLFKLRTDSFMQRGASIQFLSAFPGEEEGAFPPPLPSTALAILVALPPQNPLCHSVTVLLLVWQCSTRRSPSSSQLARRCPSPSRAACLRWWR